MLKKRPCSLGSLGVPVAGVGRSASTVCPPNTRPSDSLAGGQIAFRVAAAKNGALRERAQDGKGRPAN